MGRLCAPLPLAPIVCALALAACSGAPGAAGAPRLVLLYATCTLNKGYIQPYDAAVDFTPELQRFAQQSVVFERHVTESGQSGIAFASLFSGVQADRHNVFRHPTKLRRDLTLVSEAFGAAGWEPWFWNAHMMASHKLGYGQGVRRRRVRSLGAWEVHGERDDERARKGKDKWRVRDWEKRHFLQPSDAKFVGLLEQLASDDDYRAFVQVNLTMTHAPYHKQILRAEIEAFCSEHPVAARGVTPPELDRWLPVYEANMLDLQWDLPATVERLGLSPEELADLVRVLEAVYAADVGFLDGMFGRTLELLREHGLEDEALVVFTSDHGEVHWRENALFPWQHGMQLSEQDLGVPLLIRAPGVAPGRYSGVTRSIDVFPTLAGLCGVELPAAARIEGVDLSGVLRGRHPAPRLLAWSHTATLGKHREEEFRGWERAGRFWYSADPELMWVRVRDGDMVWRLRNLDGERWGTEVFDLATDPDETLDLFDPDDAKHARVADELARYKARLVAVWHAGPAEEAPDDEDLEAMRALGYVGDVK